MAQKASEILENLACLFGNLDAKRSRFRLDLDCEVEERAASLLASGEICRVGEHAIGDD